MYHLGIGDGRCFGHYFLREKVASPLLPHLFSDITGSWNRALTENDGIRAGNQVDKKFAPEVLTFELSTYGLNFHAFLM